ncbi:lactate racemase domain-containing protein [Stieleria sp.]|uniref:lactate racemase domain-containing protein n=1 Tax=Stieleria sp. TaxID=2795976 RepID=UPI003566C4E4
MTFPRFFTAKQSLTSHRIGDVAAEVTEQLKAEAAIEQIRPGQSVAIAVGSRGIDRIAEVTQSVVRLLIDRNAQPFVVPAMGSHGGATDQGQAATLAALGITPESVGCPIRSSMETVSIGEGPGGIPLSFDRNAAAADHLIVINRIKPHTKLDGSIQSGVCKMLMIGLGKHRGAIAFHPAFKSFDYRLDRITADVIPKILAATPFLLGIALVEDAHDSIGQIAVATGDQLLDLEPTLLRRAIEWMPKLPFRTAELLIIDAIGKEISGTGLDTNVVGRKWHDKMAGDDEWPKIDEIYVRSLTEKTAGNASGIGIAEYTHRRVAEEIDPVKTRINCITAGHPTAAALPVWFDSDREVLEAVTGQAPMDADQRRWLRISNTLDLEIIHCSEAYWEDARRSDHLEILDDPQPLRFDDQGDLV